MTDDLIEKLAAAVHDAWIGEKRKDGFHPRTECREEHEFIYEGDVCQRCGVEQAAEAVERCCRSCRYDMVPYADLPERAKEYDRAMVRAVLKALKDKG